MTFAQMAINRLNMQTAELGQFVVAFKDLSDELPENTGIQCGMFILDVFGKYLYIPVLSKAGNVQVLESMFDADSKTFIPITRKTIEWMITQGHALGTSERIPGTVARDPDLYDAIVPPKTGKYVYASEGRLGGFFATLPNHVKQATLEVITDDMAFQQAMAPLMDFDIVKAYLESETPEYVEPMGPPAPAVVTSAEGLKDDQVQEILSKGYTVVNPPKSTRIAVESDSDGSLTTIDALCQGKAYAAMRKTGDWVTIAGLRMVENNTNEAVVKNHATGEEGTRRDLSRPCTSGRGVVGITEAGEVLQSNRVVIKNAEEDYDAVISKLKSKRATEIRKGDYGMIFTGYAWFGPISVDMVEKAGGWTNINMIQSPNGAHQICIHPNVRNFYDFRGTTIIMSDVATFYPMTDLYEEDMETNINTAAMKDGIAHQRMLPVQATLMHRNGIYAVDGKEVGGKPAIIEHLLKTWDLDVPTVETFTKSAEDKGQILVKMAAATRVQPMYEHGDKPQSPRQITGNARQRAEGMATRGKAIKDVADRETMEATLISEMLQNPDLSGTILEYLPEIKQAVDRLGRSLFLMRLNTNKLSERIDAEALNNLFTATRNAYRILGENCIELQNLVAADV